MEKRNMHIRQGETTEANALDKQIKIDPALNIFGIQYQLTGIINHHGNSIRNGHYTATVRYKSWWHVNDNNVNPAPSNCFQNNSTAYLAFYRQWSIKWDRRVHQLRSGPLLLALAIVVMVYECIGGKAETWLYHNSFPTDDPACSIHCLQNFYNHHSTHSAFKLKYQNSTCSSPDYDYG